MKDWKKISGFALAAAVLALAGCSKSSTPVSPGGSSPEQSAASFTLGATPELIDEDVLETDDVGLVRSGPATGGSLAAIHPIRFWRRIDRVTRRFEFAFSDTDSTGRPTRAVVTVHKTLRGAFVIVAGDSGAEGSSDTTRRIVRKPLLDHWKRRLLLVRVARPANDTESGDRTVWKVAATSGVNVVSDLPASPDAHAHIVSIRVQSGELDTTLTDPMAFIRLRSMLRVSSGAQVTLTVTTTRPDDVVLLMARYGRFRLESHGDNTYTGTWTVPGDGGIRHFGVNALSHGTLWDDAAAYDSHAWIFPYAVIGEDLADYRP